MSMPNLPFVYGSKTVIEVAGIVLRQSLPAYEHNRIPQLIDRVSCSGHVCDNLDSPWSELSPNERRHIERELRLVTAI